jgi:hypothetical protein
MAWIAALLEGKGPTNMKSENTGKKTEDISKATTASDDNATKGLQIHNHYPAASTTLPPQYYPFYANPLHNGYHAPPPRPLAHPNRMQILPPLRSEIPSSPIQSTGGFADLRDEYKDWLLSREGDSDDRAEI